MHYRYSRFSSKHDSIPDRSDYMRRYNNSWGLLLETLKPWISMLTKPRRNATLKVPPRNVQLKTISYAVCFFALKSSRAAVNLSMTTSHIDIRSSRPLFSTSAALTLSARLSIFPSGIIVKLSNIYHKSEYAGSSLAQKDEG